MIVANQELGEFKHPKMYEYQTFEAWEAKCNQWIDIGVGLTISNPPYVYCEAMTPEDLHVYDTAITIEGNTEDLQDIGALGEVEFMKIGESENNIRKMLGEFEC